MSSTIGKKLVQELVGKVLPSYEILDILGEGSFGAVYRVKDSLKERAVKVIQLSAAASIEKGEVVGGGIKIERDFRHIVENYEKIACEEIVSVYDFYKVSSSEEKNQATAYAIVVMELYPHNLLDYMMQYFNENKKLFEIDFVRALMEKLARMLNNLYTKRGFLFEDLKPENLLVKHFNNDFKIVVGDIGGLKNMRSVNATGSQVTLSYCAAEVIRSRQKPDLRSIVYSYGLICFLALEGHLPYESEGVMERIDLIREKGLVFNRSDAPDDLMRIIKRCISFDPDDRYQNFEEVLDALHGKQVCQSSSFSAQTIDLDSFFKTNQATPSPAPAAPSSLPPRPPSFGVPRPSGATMNPLGGMRAAMTQRLVAEPRKKVDTARISNDQDGAEQIETEIENLVIRNGDLHRLQNKSYKIIGDIIVHNGGLLLIENAKIYFEENAGIISSGTVRWKNVLFSALDPRKRWSNVVLNPLDARLNTIESCKFRFGGGRSGKAIKEALRAQGYPLNDGYSYGGGIFIADVKQDLVAIQDSSFYNCTAHEGGAIYCFKAGPSITGCSFENCSSGLAGGGMNFCESSPNVVNCKLHTCLAQKEGGGMFFRASKPVLEKVVFENCSTKYLYGGGIYSMESTPVVKDCRFNRCSAMKDGGGIYCDGKTRPKILFPSFANCRPNNANISIHGGI